MFIGFKRKVQFKVETVQFQAIQLVKVKRTYLERRDRNRFREFVESKVSFALSERQLKAATSHARETMVIAGAGSGKTSVLVGRAKYLVESGRARDDQILMLAYNREAAAELTRRTRDSDINVTATTFHAFGGSIINGKDKKTIVAFGDKGSVTKFISDLFKHNLPDKIKKSLIEYFSMELVPPKDYKEFQNLNEYVAYVKSTIPKTLNGETVKSHGEWLIANFLFVNSISYEYEAVFDQGKSSKDRHRTDFLIQQDDLPPIWIEYFGIDRTKEVAPGISKEAYNESIAWKYGVHVRNSSLFIDLYYYDLKEGNLLWKLERALRAHKVKFKPKSSQEILSAANEVGYVNRFIHICEQFMGHVRARRLSPSDLLEMAGDDKRTHAFLKVFNYLLTSYEKELRKRGLPDYAELIHGAADIIQSKKYVLPYTHVLVDEYQDISNDRNRLIDSIKEASPAVEVTYVGDDWQSIYRFSGSNVSLMREASKFKGFRERIILDESYRLPQKIADVSREFIMKNPLQIDKQVISKSDLDSIGRVAIHWDMKLKEHRGNLARVIQRIGRDSTDPSISLRILARYMNNLPGEFPQNQKKNIESAIEYASSLWEGPVEVSTIHSAKGLEADYVIVMDMVQDFRGFPSTIEDDPVMKLVMLEKDLYLHGEERRLFYVALTRARRETHLISPISTPSLFTLEMLESNSGEHIGLNDSKNPQCPSCKTGRVLISAVNGGSYCSNIPFCEFSSPACTLCLSPMVYGDISKRFTCPRHPESYFEPCHICSWGVLVPRSYIDKKTGKTKSFRSCHTRPKTLCKGKKYY